MRIRWSELDRRIEGSDDEFTVFVKANEDARLLVSIPGIGVMIASARIAAIGKAESFSKGRDLGAWLGLVPKQSTTGGKPKLFGISKRGNNYLRKLLIHDARARSPLWRNVTRRWDVGRKTCSREPTKNIAVVALANKPARIAWAVLRGQAKFSVGKLPVAA
jgi:transposase